MKTRDIMLMVVVTNLISLVLGVFIAGRFRPNPPQVPQEQAVSPVPSAPASQAVSVKPAVNQDEVFALLDSGREIRRKEAIKEFKKVMQNLPPYDTMMVARGYRTAMDGDIQKALEITRQEIAKDPGSVESHYTLAWIYAKVGDYDKSLKVCEEAYRQGSGFYKLRLVEGWVYARQGKYEDALKACDAALAGEPYSALLYYAKGRIADIGGQTDKAVEYYTKTISLKSDFYGAYIFLGFLHAEQGRNEEAIKTFKQAISLEKYRPGGYVGLGMVYDEMGNYQAALEQYNNAITLGWVNLDASAPKKSLVMSIEIDDAVINNRIGILNIRTGDYRAAQNAFTQAIKARQEFHDSYRGLVLTYVLQGEMELAVKTYTELKTLDPEMAKSVASFVEQKQ